MKTSKKLFEGEIAANGQDASDERGFLCYGTITFEGDTLEECLENAQVDLIDQDGGEQDIVAVNDEVLLERIEVEVAAQMAFSRWLEQGDSRLSKLAEEVTLELNLLPDLSDDVLDVLDAKVVRYSRKMVGV